MRQFPRESEMWMEHTRPMWLALKRKVIDAKFDHAGVFIPTGGYKIALVAFDGTKVADTHTRVLSGRS